jgi:hypothetical protein
MPTFALTPMHACRSSAATPEVFLTGLLPLELTLTALEFARQIDWHTVVSRSRGWRVANWRYLMLTLPARQ